VNLPKQVKHVLAHPAHGSGDDGGVLTPVEALARKQPAEMNLLESPSNRNRGRWRWLPQWSL
jgi:hypothetical protein